MPDQDTAIPTEFTEDTEAGIVEMDLSEASSQEQPGSEQPLHLRLEALLLATDRPLTEARIAALLGVAGKGAVKRVRDAAEELNTQYEQSGRSFRADAVAGGYQLLTLPAFESVVSLVRKERQNATLSNAAMETLAIIAYRQPILRAEIEAIRGVSSGEVLRGLLERKMVKVVGRADELGRPMLYGTTQQFLSIFGLASLKDLPEVAGAARLDKPKKTDMASRQSDSTDETDEAVPESTDANESDESDAQESDD